MVLVQALDAPLVDDGRVCYRGRHRELFVGDGRLCVSVFFRGVDVGSLFGLIVSDSGLSSCCFCLGIVLTDALPCVFAVCFLLLLSSSFPRIESVFL